MRAAVLTLALGSTTLRLGVLLNARGLADKLLAK
jgi:hypothetical protein